jgi:hypothetical protein
VTSDYMRLREIYDKTNLAKAAQSFGHYRKGLMGVNSLLKELEEVMIYDSVGKRQISYQFYKLALSSRLE